MTNVAAHTLSHLPHEPGRQAPALVFPEIIPTPIAGSAAANRGYVTAQLAAHGYRTSDSHGLDIVDGLYVHDARGWLVVKHLAQLVLCSLAVTLAIVTTIPIAVSFAWGITGLVLMSVVVAADRARFIEAGRTYERARFSVIEPAGHNQHGRPDTGGSPCAVSHDTASYVAMAHRGFIASPGTAHTQQPAPFQVNVT
ncbi:MAG: hypothetical protein H7123_03010 [Thermoleophilia bacterium]|nr:hypothetical protein [Thermoleophilia bacterium]